MNKAWNGKIKGLVSALLILNKVFWMRLKDSVLSSIYKSNIGKCGKNVKIMSGFYFRNPKSITIEDDVIIARNVSFTNGDIETGVINIKKGVSIDQSCLIDYSGNIIINEHAHIAFGTYISTHDHGLDYRNEPIGKPLEIGKNAFIGAKSIIMHNCTYIGKNSVVGTGSIVTKDVPDNVVVAGNPARVIKHIE